VETPLPTINEGLKDYLMERRRILRDELAVVERQLQLSSKEQQLQKRVRDLEERLRDHPPHRLLDSLSNI
jgi:hypothetical protein